MNGSIILRYLAVVAPPKPPPTTATLRATLLGVAPVHPAISPRLPFQQFFRILCASALP